MDNRASLGNEERFNLKIHSERNDFQFAMRNLHSQFSSENSICKFSIRIRERRNRYRSKDKLSTRALLPRKKKKKEGFIAMVDSRLAFVANLHQGEQGGRFLDTGQPGINHNETQASLYLQPLVIATGVSTRVYSNGSKARFQSVYVYRPATVIFADRKYTAGYGRAFNLTPFHSRQLYSP